MTVMHKKIEKKIYQWNLLVFKKDKFFNITFFLCTSIKDKKKHYNVYNKYNIYILAKCQLHNEYRSNLIPYNNKIKMKNERTYKHKAFVKLKDFSLSFHLLLISLNTIKYSGIIPCVDMELSLFKYFLVT